MEHRKKGYRPDQVEAMMREDQPLVLTSYPNGGWTVTQGRGGGWEVVLLGAYSTTEEMLQGLGDLLAGNGSPT